MLEKGFTSCVVGEGEVEFLLGEWLHELLVHVPRLICTGNHSNSVFFLQDLLLVLGQDLSKLCEVRTGRSSSSFLFLLFALEDLLNLVHVDDCGREGLGHIECHGEHFVQLLLIVYLGFKSIRGKLENKRVSLVGQSSDHQGLPSPVWTKEQKVMKLIKSFLNKLRAQGDTDELD